MKCDSGCRSHAVLSDKPSPPRQSESNSLSGAGNSIHLVIKLSFFSFSWSCSQRFAFRLISYYARRGLWPLWGTCQCGDISYEVKRRRVQLSFTRSFKLKTFGKTNIIIIIITVTHNHTVLQKTLWKFRLQYKISYQNLCSVYKNLYF